MRIPKNPKPGFHLDYKGVGKIMKTDTGIKKRVHSIAAAGAEKAGGHVEDFVTDRVVSAIVVGAEDQAVHGRATKAAGELGLRLS